MQEGTTAFLQMVRITAAIADHKATGLPYLVYLRHPTTGGVFASWGSLGHLTFAEPQALIGFLGPRVFEALHGRPFPTNVQTTENLYRHGLLDAVCRPDELAGLVARTLDIVATPQRAPAVAAPSGRVLDTVPAWVSVQATRHLERPGVQELLAAAATDVLALHGTGQGEVDAGLIVALARFDDVSCVLVGQDRLTQADTAIGPAALRQARRGMRLAAELGLPLVSVIDTPGGALSKEAEEGGVAGEIARCIADMISLDVPTVSVLLGTRHRWRGAGIVSCRPNIGRGARMAVTPAT